MGLLLFTCFAEKLPQNNLYSNIFTTQNLKHDRVHCFVFPCGNVVSNELQSRHTISHIRTQQGHSVSSHVLCRRCDPARRRGVRSKRSRAQRRSLLFRRRSRRIRRRPRNVARFRPIEREAETFLSLSLLLSPLRMAILHDCRHDAVYRPGEGCNGSNGRVGGSRKWNI